MPPVRGQVPPSSADAMAVGARNSRMASAMIAIEPRPNWASSGVVLTLARKLKVKIASDQTPKTLPALIASPVRPGTTTKIARSA